MIRRMHVVLLLVCCCWSRLFSLDGGFVVQATTTRTAMNDGTTFSTSTQPEHHHDDDYYFSSPSEQETSTDATNTIVTKRPATSVSALKQARSLQENAPKIPSSGGEDFWDEHESLLLQARAEYGRKHQDLYDFDHPTFRSNYLEPRWNALISSSSSSSSSSTTDATAASNTKSLADLQDMVHFTEVEGAYAVKLFTKEFTTKLLQELDHYDSSGIPSRRPNTKTRYGFLLKDLGFQTMLQRLGDEILRPIALTMFPQNASLADIQEDYGFVVRYHPTNKETTAKNGNEQHQQQLRPHADASVITVNICLEPSENESALYFHDVRKIRGGSDDDDSNTLPSPYNTPLKNMTALDEPGMVVLHLGQHIHGVSPVTAPRSNLILWMHGKHGFVQVAPYSVMESITHAAQWKDQLGWS